MSCSRPTSFAKTLTAAPQQQLALYARDRSQAPALVSAATTLARDHGLVVQARTDQPSFVALDQDVQTFGQFANLLPLLFLVAAVLGAFILLSRLVAAQRAVIGTLAANGIAPRTLRRHYLGFGLVAGIAAAIPGAGRRCAPGPVVHDAVHGRARPAAARQRRCTRRRCSSRRSRASPRPRSRRGVRRAPRPGRRRPRRCASRRPVTARGRCSNGSCRPCGTCRPGGGWWCAASAATVVAPAFTIVGVAVSLSLVLVFAGLRDTVANVLDRQYGTVDRSDGQLYATPGKAGELVAAARRDPAVAAAEPFARVEVTLTHGAKRFDTILMGLPADTTMHRFVEPGGRPSRCRRRVGCCSAAASAASCRSVPVTR